MIRRVVIVDDDRLFRVVVRLCLSDDGRFDVVGEAANGSEALPLVDSLHPQAVLVDMEMPVMDGLSTYREICRKWPEIAVVMLTGSEIDGELAAGAESLPVILHKERFDPHELCEALAAV